MFTIDDNYTVYNNNISNHDMSTNDSFNKLLTQIFIGVLLYSLTIWTIIGNIFVWIALFTNRQLKQGGMSNYLIGNLALSDLLLGLTVLPFSATSSTLKHWVFGTFLCDIWLSIDVLCCTASIWGLLVIAIDRYIATNHPIVYRQQKNSIKTAVIYCTISWIVSLAISIPPFVHDLYSSINNNTQAKESDSPRASKNLQINIENKYECVLYYKPSFVIGSSLGSFYIPLILMVLLYARVFIRIKQQSNLFKNTSMPTKKAKTRNIPNTETNSRNVPNNQNLNPLTKMNSYEDTDHHEIKLIESKDEKKVKPSISSYDSPSFVRNSTKKKLIYKSDPGSLQLKDKKSLLPTEDHSMINTSQLESKPIIKNNSELIKSSIKSIPRSQMSISSTEARITKTLAIIIVAFVLCWFPFFTAYIIRSQLSANYQISPSLMDIFIWLGYFNSALNPILYAILNNNFRTAFKDILSCECFRKRRSKQTKYKSVPIK